MEVKKIMKNESKTLFIPLYGKAKVSREGLILKDKKAEEIWEAEGFALHGKAKSKWLAYFMGMRSAAIDEWTMERIHACPKAMVLHIGCGLDSRVLRVGTMECDWYDIDLTEVIDVRKQYYAEHEHYKMIAGNAEEPSEWLKDIPKDTEAIVVMEGISMYLDPDKLKELFLALQEHFTTVSLIMDVYTSFGVKASKYKNPVNTVGAGVMNGIDDPKILELNQGILMTKKLSLTPPHFVEQLSGFDKAFFQKMFTGKTADRIYRMYEYKMN